MTATLPSTACFGRALDAYASRELQRIADFRAGHLPPPAVPTTALMLALQGESWAGQVPLNAIAHHDFLVGLAWGLRHIAQLDTELHDHALKLARDVDDMMTQYD